MGSVMQRGLLHALALKNNLPLKKIITFFTIFMKNMFVNELFYLKNYVMHVIFNISNETLYKK